MIKKFWGSSFKEFLKYLGPGFFVTVGFIDPGNWATNIAGGAKFNYSLLWVITLSTIMLIYIQNLSAKIGIISGGSFAANIRANYPRFVSNFLGATIVLACIATDIAEYLGAAIGFNLLFGIPLYIGAPLTVLFVFFAILGQRFKNLERMVVSFFAVIAGCYVVELFIVKPDMSAAVKGMVIPTVSSGSILIAMGMLGAVVMPHNIYLHSNVIQSRDWTGDEAKKRRLIRLELADTTIAMVMGWLVNSSMIIVAAAVFFKAGLPVESIEKASETLRPLAGNMAQLLFGTALLFAGVGSSITSSLAEANIITGFLGKPEDTHSKTYRIALIATSIPAMFIIAMGLDSFKILIISQVALSLQLPFTVIPLLMVSRNKKIMGNFAISSFNLLIGGIITAVIIFLNGLLLYQLFGGKF